MIFITLHVLLETQVYINDDPGLTLTYLRQGQIGSSVHLKRENCYKVI